MNKCVIFGGSSYIGKHFVKYLEIKKIDYTIYNKNYSENSIKCDIVNDNDILKSIDWNVDAVFIFSGKTGTSKSFEDAKQYIDINEIGLLNILNSIVNTEHRPKIMFPSSRLVYKGKNIPIKENDSLEFKTIYALSKINAENILQLYSKTFKLPFTIFRICVPYGNEIDSTYSYGTIGFFINQGLYDKKITLYNYGELNRTFTHINDLINQIYHLSINQNTDNEIFNIKGETFSLKEIATMIASQLNVNIIYKEWPNFDKIIESGDTIFDNDKIDKTISNNKLNYSFKDWINNLQF
jgi:UDP-glucose 4-epimerase